jgi:hypothetical protein
MNTHIGPTYRISNLRSLEPTIIFSRRRRQTLAAAKGRLFALSAGTLLPLLPLSLIHTLALLTTFMRTMMYPIQNWKARGLGCIGANGGAGKPKGK